MNSAPLDFAHEAFTATASWQTVGAWHYRFQFLTHPIVNYNYVDETADIARHYEVDRDGLAPSPVASERRRSEVSPDQQALTEPSIISDTVGSHSSEQFLSSHRPISSTLAGYTPYPLDLSPPNHSSLSSASPGYSHSSQISPGSRDLIPQVENGLPSLDEHEACLMRYFVVQLAPWVGFPLFSKLFRRLTNTSSLIYVMVTGILLVPYPYELEHVLRYSTPSTPHQRDI